MKQLFYSMFLALSTVLMLTGCQKEDPINSTKFTVTFHTDGGSEVKAVMVADGEKLAEPTIPTKGEFIFAGWFKEATYVTAWDFEKDVVSKDITLYAKWTTVTYTVTFSTDGGSAVAPIKVAKGSAAIRPLPPTKSNVAFGNWYKEVALTNVYDFSTPVNADITLYAKWVTVTRETLQVLFAEASNLNRSNYTDKSFDAMRSKCNAAGQILAEESSSIQQIITAYTELSAAMNALVALPYRAVVTISIYNLVDNIVYAKPGEHFRLHASASAANYEPATDGRVKFSYNASQLETWTDGPIYTTDNELNFPVKSTLADGTTISITIESAENPAISKTVTLNVLGNEGIKVLFINAVNALPAPSQIDYKDHKAITTALSIYYSISSETGLDAEIQAAYKKLRECEEAYYNLPVRMKYSFKGNICTLISMDDDIEDIETLDLTFVANGVFPAGTFTENGWTPSGKDDYYQTRLILKSDKTGLTDYRYAEDANGKEATEWGTETDILTYTFEGTQNSGGIFYLKFMRDETEPTPKSFRSANTARASHSIFKMSK